MKENQRERVVNSAREIFLHEEKGVREILYIAAEKEPLYSFVLTLSLVQRLLRLNGIQPDKKNKK